MATGMVLAILHPDYFLSIWGNKIACPIIGGSANIIGCNPAFVYVPTFFGVIAGGIIGFLIGALRKTIEEVTRIKGAHKIHTRNI